MCIYSQENPPFVGEDPLLCVTEKEGLSQWRTVRNEDKSVINEKEIESINFLENQTSCIVICVVIEQHTTAHSQYVSLDFTE